MSCQIEGEMANAVTWIQVFQLGATIGLGLGAFSIAYMQWKTAHTKILIDLFDRRSQAIDELTQMAERFSKMEEIPLLDFIALDGKFYRLFGDDVTIKAMEVVQDLRESHPGDLDMRKKIAEDIGEIHSLTTKYVRITEHSNIGLDSSLRKSLNRFKRKINS